LKLEILDKLKDESLVTNKEALALVSIWMHQVYFKELALTDDI
jgi:hypothetical protein